jgi:hypothetical protein
MRNFSDGHRKNQNTHFMLNTFFSKKSCHLWDNVKKTVKLDRPQMTIRCVRTACWIPKATNTHSDYVILIALPLQQLLYKHALMLHYKYIPCLVCYCSYTYGAQLIRRVFHLVTSFGCWFLKIQQPALRQCALPNVLISPQKDFFKNDHRPSHRVY